MPSSPLPMEGCTEGPARLWIPHWVKRLFDFFTGCILLVLFAPLLLVTWILVLRHFGRPALFAQVRPGLGGKPFRLFKFRTMANDRDATGDLLPDEVRLTPIGQRIRRLSLDELPQLFNVIRGDMSLVGPRPLLMRYLDRYTTEQARRHLMRPGVTGLAQVMGRNSLDWDTKFAYDIWYVDHWNFSLDLRILLLTIARVLKRDGISSQGSTTMEEFMGIQGPKQG